MRPTKVIGRIRDGKLVREKDEAESKNVDFPVGSINWELLARQKTALINMLKGRNDHILNGLVNLIDDIQDRSSREGHPVVWLETEESITHPPKGVGL